MNLEELYNMTTKKKKKKNDIGNFCKIEYAVGKSHLFYDERRYHNILFDTYVNTCIIPFV